MAEWRWPDDWDERMAGKDCPLCGSLGAADNERTVMVAGGTFADVRLERKSRLPGYCIVVWNRGHVAEPSDLPPAEAAAYWAEVVDVGRALRDELAPLKLNYQTLGNTVPHLHTHVVPRYRDDPAPAGPLPWDDLFQPEARPDEELHDLAGRLRRRLGR